MLCRPFDLCAFILSCALKNASSLCLNVYRVQFVVAVGILLVVVLAFTYPQNAPQLGLASLGCYNWSSPLSHVRLLSLPIAKKYNLQGRKRCHSVFSPNLLTNTNKCKMFVVLHQTIKPTLLLSIKTIVFILSCG